MMQISFSCYTLLLPSRLSCLQNLALAFFWMLIYNKNRREKNVLGDNLSGLWCRLDLLTIEFYPTADSLLNSEPYNLPTIFPLFLVE